MDDLTPRLDSALASPNPRAQLQRLINELLEKGCERGDLLPALQSYHFTIAQQPARADDADLILEIIDGFTGWCNLPYRPGH